MLRQCFARGSRSRITNRGIDRGRRFNHRWCRATIVGLFCTPGSYGKLVTLSEVGEDAFPFLVPLSADDGERVDWADDRNSGMGTKDQQIRVPGDNEIGLSRDGKRQHRIVVGDRG